MAIQLTGAQEGIHKRETMAITIITVFPTCYSETEAQLTTEIPVVVYH